MYGCGDLINDYEGNPVKAEHQHLLRHLGSVFLARLSSQNGELLGLEMIPTRIHRLQVQRADSNDAHALCTMLNTHSELFGTRIALDNAALMLKID